MWAQHMLLAAVERNPGLQDLPSTCRESMQMCVHFQWWRKGQIFPLSMVKLCLSLAAGTTLSSSGEVPALW